MDQVTVEKIEYNQQLCKNTQQLVCPYCEVKEDITLDGYTQPNETGIAMCSDCSKYFAYVTLYDPLGFTTQPIENYYLEERERLLTKQRIYQNITEPLDVEDLMLRRINAQLHSLEFDRINYVMPNSKD